MIKEKVSMGTINPIIPSDYPDPDVIRVGDVYYLASTTMHFFPGCEILRSYDLLHWEHAAYVYDKLDSTEGQCLTDGVGIYGKGMWAPCLRYHNNCFYLMFVANDTQKTYLYKADSITGPWKKQYIEGFYHDGSILFDEDRVFVAFGNTEIKLVELDSDLKGPKEGGLQRTLVKDVGNKRLGYEGCHFYKINDKYYLFLIHSLPDRWMRTQNYFVASSLEGEFHGGEIFCDDMGYFGQGVAQGGIVDTPDGHWFTMLFQDRGGVGRTPFLLPLRWKGAIPYIDENGKLPAEIEICNTNPDHEYIPLAGSDDFSEGAKISDVAEGRKTDNAEFDSFGMRSFWQFNHQPEVSLVKQDTKKKRLLIKTDRLCDKFDQVINTLTQRMTLPRSRASVIVNVEDLKVGDRAGLGILFEEYCYLAIEKTVDGNDLILISNEEGKEVEKFRQSLGNEKAYALRFDANTFAPVGNATVFYRKLSEKEFNPVPFSKSLKFTLAHFVGCRFALFMFSTKESGGEAAFSEFKYEIY
ncbi:MULTISPECIES: glycoside hydrolase family 43 protein [unclassified Butyrivibrio]|uniref:glycoside hydrolase family 43 protein n=1 Tax=unclassified Butyrivibrio TaxID=2639466 RepID=UPI000684DDFF|nr:MULTISPECIES: glycoside hydrolase 43 family protein [unclassified Butyrivibrio]